jgi:hypothetical protein
MAQQDGRTIVSVSTDDGVSIALTGAGGTDGSTSGTRMIRVGGSDGTNDQIFYSDTTGRLWVNRNWTNAGEDIANGWQSVREMAHATLTASAAVTVNGANVEVMASTNVANYREVSVNLYNSGANPLTACTVSGSNDGTRWVSLVPIYGALETACSTLAGSGTDGCAWLSTGFPFNYIKVQCSSGASTTITYYLFCRA